MKNYLKKKWRSWRNTALLIACVALPIRASIAGMSFVPTGSMNPAILEGDFVFTNLLSYDLRVPLTDFRLARWADPERGDIVICFSPDDDTRLVKRVIGVPGDRIEMRSQKLFLNGEAVAYQPIDEQQLTDLSADLRQEAVFATEMLEKRDHAVMALPNIASELRSFPEVTLADGEYFVMGDNRDNSQDSRTFGVVPRDEIVGEATHVVMSFDKLDTFQPRWARFFPLSSNRRQFGEDHSFNHSVGK